MKLLIATSFVLVTLTGCGSTSGTSDQQVQATESHARVVLIDAGRCEAVGGTIDRLEACQKARAKFMRNLRAHQPAEPAQTSK